MKNIEDIEFRLLTEKEIFGDKNGNGQLDIFKIYGKSCIADDVVILSGAYVQEYKSKYTDALKYHCWWLSQTSVQDKYIRIVSDTGEKYFASCEESYAGIRPAVKYSDIKDMCYDERRGFCGIKEVKCFTKSSYVVDEDMQQILEENLLDGNLIITDKKIPRNFYDHSHGEKSFNTYIFQEEAYSRVRANFCEEENQLTNGITYQKGSYVWVKEEPCTLLVSKEKDIAIFENAIIAGIPFDINQKNKYDMPYNQTFMAKFLKEKLPMMLKPAQAIQKSAGIDQLEFSMNPNDIASLYQNGNITLKNASGESVKINLEEKKESVKINRKAKIGFEKLI